MSPAAIAALSADILGLCKAAELHVDSIDFDERASCFVVSLTPRGEMLLSLYEAMRQRRAYYDVLPVYDGKLPMDRLEFRVRGTK